MRVLIACDHIDFDGALHGGGRQLIELTRALADYGVEPTVCVLRRASALGRELQAEGLPFHFFGDHPYSPAPLGRFVRLIRRRRIEVLHLTDFGACTFGRLAGWLTGTPTIVQVISHHSEFTHRRFPPHVALAYRTLAPLTARTLAISDSVKEFAVERMGFAPDEVEVLHYPLPRHSFTTPTAAEVAAVRRQHGIGPHDPVIGAVTRLFPVKGIRYLIEAFARVRRDHPAAWLVIVGQGPEEPALRALAAELGVAERVLFAGFQRQVERYVAMFDVSAVPSLEEGFGLVAVESLALRVPVVASRLGGLPDVVADGQSGLLVPPAEPAALADALSRLLGDPALRARMGEAGHAGAQRFSLDRYVGRLTEIYRGLAADRAGPRPQPTVRATALHA